MPVSWPDTVDEILGGDLTAALAYATPAGGAVVVAVAPVGLRDRDEGTVSFTTSLGLGRKLERIRQEPRVALAILEDPAGTAGLAIGTLAERCETSPATVLRFCRAIGFRSYPTLRLELARETGRERNGHETPSPTGDISPTDTVPQIVAKIAWSDARAIEDTAALLDIDSLTAAIDAVAGARRIDIFGVSHRSEHPVCETEEAPTERLEALGGIGHPGRPPEAAIRLEAKTG